jgi:hypothetical protein
MHQGQNSDLAQVDLGLNCGSATFVIMGTWDSFVPSLGLSSVSYKREDIFTGWRSKIINMCMWHASM